MGWRQITERLRDDVDRYLAGPMFLASLGFLVLLAGVLQDARHEVLLPRGTHLHFWGLAVLWPVFVVEMLVHLVLRSRFWKQHLVYCLLPPLRLGGRDHQTGRDVWLPFWGWVTTDRALRRRLERAFSGPMMVVALLVLPVLAIDFFFSRVVETNPYVAFFQATGTSIIWLAFAIEFIIMASVVDQKLRYCRRHWVDLVIICLPLVAFLRVLRLGQLVRLQQVARAGRVYRLRGLTMRMYRAAMALNLLRFVVRGSPEKRLAALRYELAERQYEIEELRQEIDKLEKELAAPMQRFEPHIRSAGELRQPSRAPQV